MTDVSSDTVLPTFPAAVSRTLAAFTSDRYNIKDFGVLLDGSAADAGRINSAYNNIPNGTVVDIPPGHWAGLTALDTTKTIFWNILGFLDNGVSASWVGNTAFGSGVAIQVVVYGTSTSAVFTCSTAGTTGTSQPHWPSSGTVTDGT